MNIFYSGFEHICPQKRNIKSAQISGFDMFMKILREFHRLLRFYQRLSCLIVIIIIAITL